MTVYKYNPESGRVEPWTPPPPPDHAFYIMPEFQPYRAVGVDNSVVTSRSQHKQMLKDNNLEEVGNEKPKWMKDRELKRREEGSKDG